MIKSISIIEQKGERPYQEDCAWASSDRRLFMVADGFGGPSSGVAASQKACESIRHFMEKEAGDRDATLPFEIRPYFSLSGNIVLNALTHANRALMKMNFKKGVHEKGGTSVVMGYMDQDRLVLGQVGCCQAGLIRDGKWFDLVQPRSWLKMTTFDSPSAHDCDIPLMALGVFDEIEPEVCEYKVKVGDWVVLATDGLGAQVRTQICQLQTQGLAAEQVPYRLKEYIRGQELSDNISISLAII